MGLGMLIVAAGAVAAGYYGYRRLQEIEEEIRGDIAGASENREAERTAEVKSVQPVRAVPESAEREMERPPETGTSLEERLSEEVRKEPGILQTSLYERFPEVNRKVLQQTLLKMDRDGSLKRTREKGSYALHPG